MKTKNLLVVILVLLASCMSLVFAGCRGVYDDVSISISIENGDVQDGITLTYDYNEELNTYEISGPQEFMVEVNGLEGDMLSSVSYSQTNNNLLSLSLTKQEYGKYLVTLMPYLDGNENIIQGGRTRITFMSDAGNKKASINVNVKIPLKNIKEAENKSNLYVVKGKEVVLVSSNFISFTPQNTTFKDVDFEFVNADDGNYVTLNKTNNTQTLLVNDDYPKSTLQLNAVSETGISETITLSVLPGDEGEDIVVSSIVQGEGENHVTLYSESAGSSKTMFVNVKSDYAYTLSYQSTNANVVRVIDLTMGGHEFNSFSLEYNQEGSAEVYIYITFPQFNNYVVSKKISVDCVLLPTQIDVWQDGKVIDEDSNYVIYDNYNKGQGSNIKVNIGTPNVESINRRFVALFKTDKKLNEVIDIVGTNSYIDASTLLKTGETLETLASRLTVEDVNGKILTNDSSFYLRAIDVNSDVEMLVVPYAYIVAGGDVLENADKFVAKFKTSIGADSVKVNSIENLDNNIYYIEKGTTANLTFTLTSVRNNVSVAPMTRIAELEFTDAALSKESLEVTNYNYGTTTSQQIKIKAIENTASPLSVRLVLDNGVLSKTFYIFVYSELKASDINIKATSNLNTNSSLGDIAYKNNSLSNVHIAQHGALGLEFENIKNYTVNNVSYEIRNSLNELITREIKVSNNVLLAVSPIKNAVVVVNFTTFVNAGIGRVDKLEVSKSFVVTVFRSIDNLSLEKQTIDGSYDKVNYFTLYYMDSPLYASSYFNVMDYYSREVYKLSSGSIRVVFEDEDNVDSFGALQYKWSVSNLLNTKNGETLTLNKADSKECYLQTYRNPRGDGTDNEVRLTCTITQYNKVYSISAVVVLKDLEHTTNLNISENEVYLEKNNENLQETSVSYKLYKQTATNKYLDYYLLSGTNCVNVEQNIENSSLTFSSINGGVATYILFATDSTNKTKTSLTEARNVLKTTSDVDAIRSNIQNMSAGEIEEYLKPYVIDGLIYKVVKVTVADGESEETAFQITSKKDFEKIQENGSNKWYVVTQDIDLGEFEPLDEFTGGFSGNYNGRISTLTIEQSLGSSNYYGLFRTTKDATIKDLNLNYIVNGEKTVNGNLYIGAITGKAEQSQENAFQNIKVSTSGNVTLAFNGNYSAFIGGAVGFNEYYKNENSCLYNVSVNNNLQIETRGDYTKTETYTEEVDDGNGNITTQEKTRTFNSSLFVGGVVGVNNAGKILGTYSNLTNSVDYSYSTGSISVNNTSANEFADNNMAVGGVIGKNARPFDSYYTLTRVGGYYCNTIIETNLSNVGGIVGLNAGSITDCLFSGIIHGENNVGGIVGLAEMSLGAQYYEDLTISYCVVEIIKNSKNITEVIKGNENVAGFIGKIGSSFVKKESYDYDGVTNRFETVGTVGYNIYASYVKAYSQNLIINGTQNVAGFVGYAKNNLLIEFENPSKVVAILSQVSVCSSSVVAKINYTQSQNFYNETLFVSNSYNNTSGKNSQFTNLGLESVGGDTIVIDEGCYVKDASNYSDPIVLKVGSYILGKISPKEITINFNEVDRGKFTTEVYENESEILNVIKVKFPSNSSSFAINLSDILSINNGAEGSTIPFANLIITSQNENVCKVVVNTLYIYKEGEIELNIESKYSDVSSSIKILVVFQMESYEITNSGANLTTAIVDDSQKEAISIKFKNGQSLALFEQIDESVKTSGEFKIKVQIQNDANLTMFTINGADILTTNDLLERSSSYILAIKSSSNSQQKLYLTYYAVLEKTLNGEKIEISLSPKEVIEIIVYTGAKGVTVVDADEIYVNATSTSVVNVNVETDNTNQELILKVKQNNTLLTFDGDITTSFSSFGGNNGSTLVKGFVDGTLKDILSVNYTTIRTTNSVKFIYTVTPLLHEKLLELDMIFTADDYFDEVRIVLEPVEVTNISINNYTSFQNKSNDDSGYEFNMSEAPSNEVAPGALSLVVVDIYPENSMFDEMQIEYEANNASISLMQLVLLQNENQGISNNYTYKLVRPTAIPLENGRGLRLSNLSNIDENDNLNFDGKFYIGVLCNTSAREDQVVKLKVRSIRYNNDEIAYEKVAIKELIIKAQTTIDLSVNGETVTTKINNTDYICAPVGTQIDLNVIVKNTTAKANLSIGYIDTFMPYKNLQTAYKPILNTTNNTIYVNYLSDINKRFYVTASIVENINGTYKEYVKTIYFVTVEYLVDTIYIDEFDITENGSEAIGKIKVLQGAKYNLNAKVVANKGNLDETNYQYNQAVLTYNTLSELYYLGVTTPEQEKDFKLQSDLIAAMGERHNEILKSISLFEREVSNTQTIAPKVNNENYIIWQAKSAKGTENVASQKQVGNIKFSTQVVDGVNIYTYTGTDTGTQTQLILTINYGILQGKPSVFMTNANGFNTFVGEVTVVSSNTLETPTPIFTKEEFYNMSNDPTKHYILMNDLDFTTTGYKSVLGNFLSLDGNGNTIYLTNINPFENQNNFGIFSEIQENCVIKNLVVMYKNSDNNSYTMKVDLSKITSTINFGLFAGTNAGVINNCMVVPYVDGSEVKTVTVDIKTYSNTNLNFGGFVGENTGEILYSNISNNFIEYKDESESYLCVSKENGSTEVVSVINYDEEKYEILTNFGLDGTIITKTLNVLPFESDEPAFNIVSQGVVAGFTSKNSGNIVASYSKNVGVYNLSTSVNGAKTAGFVAENSGTIHESYVEGPIDKITYLPKTDENYFASITTQNGISCNIYKLPFIFSKTNIGGFVYQNSSNGSINNSYASINLFTNARSGGFVFTNEGNILNTYTNSTNAQEENSSAHTYFTGTNNLSIINNTGTIEFSYYISPKNIITEGEEYKDPAIQIFTSSESAFGNFDIEGETQESVWQWVGTTNSDLTSAGRPILKATQKVAQLNRALTKFDYIGETITTYYFEDVNIGKRDKYNPLLVSTAEEFMNAIFEKGSTQIAGQFATDLLVSVNLENGETIKSYEDSVETLSSKYYTGYIRILKDIDLNVELSDITDPLYTQKRAKLSELIFAGVIDGCYHTISGLTLTSSNSAISNQSFGMFAQVGVSTNVVYKDSNDKSNYKNNKNLSGNNSTPTTTIKNLSLEVTANGENARVGKSDARSVGVLAGEAVNASLINIHVFSDAFVTIVGSNYVGGLVGRISENSRAESITVQNISVSAEYVNLPASASNAYDYSSWLLEEEITEDGDEERNSYISKYKFTQSETEDSYKCIINEKYTNEAKVSYAGGAIGVVDLFSQGTNANSHITNKIKNVKVFGNLNISGEYAGGVLGYLFEENLATQLVFEVESAQGTQNIAGFFTSGGLVAENHGVISKSYLEAEKQIALQIDNGEGAYPNTLFNPYVINNKPSKSRFVGGVAGLNYGAVEMSYTKAPVINNNSEYVGGIVGANVLTTYAGKAIGDTTSAAKLDQVYATGNVLGSTIGYTGGIVGYYLINNIYVVNGDGSITTNISNKGFTKDNVSNIVALNNFKVTTSNVGAVYGEIKANGSDSFTIGENVYYNKFKDYQNSQKGNLNIVAQKPSGIIVQDNNIGAAIKDGEDLINIVKSNEDVKVNVIFKGFDVSNWDKENYLYPRLVMNARSVYEEIRTENDLRAMDVNGKYVLVNDIYLSHEWNPLDFAGVLTSKAYTDSDGKTKYYTIYNINIDEESIENSGEYVGFFSVVGPGATITNVNFVFGGNTTLPNNANNPSYISESEDGDSKWFDVNDRTTPKNYFGDFDKGIQVGSLNSTKDDHIVGVGSLIGRSTKSYIANCKVKFTEGSSIQVGTSNISYVGGFIAYAFENTAIMNNTLENAKITLTSEEKSSNNPEDKTTYVGGFIGSSNTNATETGNSINETTISVTHDKTDGLLQNLLVGGVYGAFSNSSDSANFTLNTASINLTSIKNTTILSVGGAIGSLNSNLSGSFTNHVSIKVNGSNSTNNYIGGFVGSMLGTSENGTRNTINTCSSYSVDISVSGAETLNIGGFAGYLESIANITNSGVYGIINATKLDGATSIGGFVGSNQGTISKSFSNTTIKTETLTQFNNIGGFAGYNYNSGEISYCYSVGLAVIINNEITKNSYVGGFVGVSGYGTTTQYCYTLTSIYANNSLGNNNIGGFAGLTGSSADNDDYNAKVLYCYYIHNLALVPHNEIGLAVTRNELNSALSSEFTTNNSYYPYINVNNADVLKCLGTNSSNGFIEGTRFNPIEVDDEEDFNTQTSNLSTTYPEYILTSDITLTDNITINGFVNANGYTINLNNGATISVGDKNTLTVNETSIDLTPTFTGSLINIGGAGTHNTAFDENQGTIFNTLVTTLDSDNRSFTSVASETINGFINTNNGTIINSGTNAKFNLQKSFAGNINGFVGTNNGTIYNCYTTVEFKNIGETDKGTISGFVGTNDGSISNSYTAMLYVNSENKNTQYNFTNKEGTLTNCFADAHSMPYATSDIKDIKAETKLMQTQDFIDKYLKSSAWQVNVAFNYGYPVLKDYSFTSKTDNTTLIKLDEVAPYKVESIKEESIEDSNRKTFLRSYNYLTALYTGDGSDSNNAYQITHPGMLKALNENGNTKLVAESTDTNGKIIKNTRNFKLTYDLDMHTYNTYNTYNTYSSGWTPVNLQTYNTSFDGGNYQIKNLVLQEGAIDDNNHLGLFTTNASIEIKNLVVPNVDFRVSNRILYASVLVATSGRDANDSTATFNNIIVNVAPESEKTLNTSYFGVLIGSTGKAGTQKGELIATNCFVNIENITIQSNYEYTYVGFLAGATRANSTITSCTTLGNLKFEYNPLYDSSGNKVGIDNNNNKQFEEYKIGGLVGNSQNALTINSSATLGNVDITDLADNATTTDGASIYNNGLFVGGFVGNSANLILNGSYSILTIDGIDYTNAQIMAGGFVGKGNVDSSSQKSYYDSSYTKTIAYRGIEEDTGDVDTTDDNYDTNMGIGSAVNLKSDSLKYTENGKDVNNYSSSKNKFGQLPIQTWLTDTETENALIAHKDFDGNTIYYNLLQDIFTPWVDYNETISEVQDGAKLNPLKLTNTIMYEQISHKINENQPYYVILDSEIIWEFSEDLSIEELFDGKNTYIMGGGATIRYDGFYPFIKFAGFMANVDFERRLTSESKDLNPFAGVAQTLDNATLFKVAVKPNNIEGEGIYTKISEFGGLAVSAKNSYIIDCDITMATLQKLHAEIIGGLICKLQEGDFVTIVHSSSNILIEATNYDVKIGGFIGYISNISNATIISSTNNSDLSSRFCENSAYFKENSDAYKYTESLIATRAIIGGFIGFIEDSNTTIKNSINSEESQIKNLATWYAYSGGFIGQINSINNFNTILSNNQNLGKVKTGDKDIKIKIGKLDEKGKIKITFSDKGGIEHEDDSIAVAGGFIGNINTSKNIVLSPDVTNVNYGEVSVEKYTTLTLFYMDSRSHLGDSGYNHLGEFENVNFTTINALEDKTPYTQLQNSYTEEIKKYLSKFTDFAIGGYYVLNELNKLYEWVAFCWMPISDESVDSHDQCYDYIYKYAGGAMGFVDAPDLTVTISNFTNYGNITADGYYNSNHKTKVEGEEVYQNIYASGIIGYIAANRVEISKCTNGYEPALKDNTQPIITSLVYVCGIAYVSNNGNCTKEECYNYGELITKTNSDYYKYGEINFGTFIITEYRYGSHATTITPGEYKKLDEFSTNVNIWWLSDKSQSNKITIDLIESDGDVVESIQLTYENYEQYQNEETTGYIYISEVVDNSDGNYKLKGLTIKLKNLNSGAYSFGILDE